MIRRGLHTLASYRAFSFDLENYLRTVLTPEAQGTTHQMSGDLAAATSDAFYRYLVIDDRYGLRSLITLPFPELAPE